MEAYGRYVLEGLPANVVAWMTTWPDDYVWLALGMAVALIDSDWLFLVIFLYLAWGMK